MTDRAAGRSHPVDETFYVERRWLASMQVIALAAVLVAAVVGLVDTVREEPEDIAGVALLSLGLFTLLLVIFVSPLTVGFGHIHVDRSGLALWWGRLLRLPAAELGDAYVVPEEEAGPAARSGWYGDVRIPTGRSSYSVHGGMGPAVFVEQRRAARAPVGWLLATRNPDAVVDALERVRRTNQDG